MSMRRAQENWPDLDPVKRSWKTRCRSPRVISESFQLFLFMWKCSRSTQIAAETKTKLLVTLLAPATAMEYPQLILLSITEWPFTRIFSTQHEMSWTLRVWLHRIRLNTLLCARKAVGICRSSKGIALIPTHFQFIFFVIKEKNICLIADGQPTWALSRGLCFCLHTHTHRALVLRERLLPGLKMSLWFFFCLLVGSFIAVLVVVLLFLLLCSWMPAQ